MHRLPVVSHDDLDAPAAIWHGRGLTVASLLGHVAATADVLPDRPCVLNLCRDRVSFAIGLLAALTRGQTTLLPPDDAPLTLVRLASDYPGLYGLTDRDLADAPFPIIRTLDFDPARSSSSCPEVAPEQPAVLLFTSGSSGAPQPHLKPWRALIESTRAAGSRLGIRAYAGAAVVGSVPAQHAFGLESTVLLPLQHGLVLHSERPFYPADVAAALASVPRPRVLVTTPVHLRAILFDPAPVPPADLVICATAPLSRELAAQAEARFGCALMEIYGCSETGQLASRRTVESAQWHCLPGMTLRQDESGTWARGPIDGEILLSDVIELAAPDRFHLLGRTSDLVNIAGKRSSLAALNAHLLSIPGVRDGVFVVPDQGDGATARLMAFAVAPALTAEALLAALRQRVDPVFLPRPLCLVEQLPRSALGKLPREHLQRLMALADAS